MFDEPFEKLAKAVSRVESSGFPYAVRFESGMFANKVGNASPAEFACMRWNKCNVITARMLCCTSWGLFQIMGFNLYDTLKLEVPIGSFLFDPETQERAFEDFVKLGGFDPRNFDPSDDNLRTFARYYNGPGAVDDYSAELKAAFASLN